MLGMWNGVAAFGKHYGNSSEWNNYHMIQKQVSSGYIFQLKVGPETDIFNTHVHSSIGHN